MLKHVKFKSMYKIAFYISIFASCFLISCVNNVEKGEEAFKNENYEEALDFFKAANKLDPNSYYILYNIARCHEELGDFKEAVPYYSKSIKINPKFVEGFLGRARCNMKMEKYESVIVDTDNILALDERNFEANSMKGKCCFKLMQFMDATHYFNEALKTNPDHLILSPGRSKGILRRSIWCIERL